MKNIINKIDVYKFIVANIGIDYFPSSGNIIHADNENINDDFKYDLSPKKFREYIIHFCKEILQNNLGHNPSQINDINDIKKLLFNKIDDIDNNIWNNQQNVMEQLDNNISNINTMYSNLDNNIEKNIESAASNLIQLINIYYEQLKHNNINLKKYDKLKDYVDKKMFEYINNNGNLKLLPINSDTVSHNNFKIISFGKYRDFADKNNNKIQIRCSNGLFERYSKKLYDFYKSYMETQNITVFMFQEACKYINTVFDDNIYSDLIRSYNTGTDITNNFVTGIKKTNGINILDIANKYLSFLHGSKSPRCQVSMININNNDIILFNIHNNISQKNASETEYEIIQYIKLAYEFMHSLNKYNLIISGDFNYDIFSIRNDIRKKISNNIVVTDFISIYKNTINNCYYDNKKNLNMGLVYYLKDFDMDFDLRTTCKFILRTSSHIPLVFSLSKKNSIQYDTYMDEKIKEMNYNKMLNTSYKKFKQQFNQVHDISYDIHYISPVGYKILYKYFLDVIQAEINRFFNIGKLETLNPGLIEKINKKYNDDIQQFYQNKDFDNLISLNNIFSKLVTYHKINNHVPNHIQNIIITILEDMQTNLSIDDLKDLDVFDLYEIEQIFKKANNLIKSKKHKTEVSYDQNKNRKKIKITKEFNGGYYYKYLKYKTKYNNLTSN